MNAALVPPTEHPLLLTSDCSNPVQAIWGGGGGAHQTAQPQATTCFGWNISAWFWFPCPFRTVISWWKKLSDIWWAPVKEAQESMGSRTQRWFRRTENVICQHPDTSGALPVNRRPPQQPYRTLRNRRSASGPSEAACDTLRDIASQTPQGQAKPDSIVHQALASGHSITREKNINPAFVL